MKGPARLGCGHLRSSLDTAILGPSCRSAASPLPRLRSSSSNCLPHVGGLGSGLGRTGGGDELALIVSASADHPSDLSPFVIGLTYGPAGVEPVGRLVPYQVNRRSGTVTWGEPREVRASRTQGLWVEVLGPMCLARTAVASKPTLADLLDQNRRLGHVVLQL
jgi:hypothetical protein